MIAVLVPKLRRTPVTAPSRPAMMEPTPIMVPVPMVTPSTVRNERILCSRTVARAKPMAELSSTHVIVFLWPLAHARSSEGWPLAYERGVKVRSSFHPECLDRIELGGLLRRIDSEEQADSGG